MEAYSFTGSIPSLLKSYILIGPPIKGGRSGSAEAENKLDGIEKRRRDQDDLYEEVNEYPQKRNRKEDSFLLAQCQKEADCCQ